MEDLLIKTSVTRRCICILDHPISGLEKTNAVQLILPQNQTKRNTDIYIMMLGDKHGVCKKGFYLAIISTTKEKENVEEDLKVAFEIVGSIKYRFDLEETMYSPKEYKDNIFITSSLDATSHFESSSEDVMKVYKAMTGKELDLTIE
jgi:Rab GDP dissociation inhibitor